MSGKSSIVPKFPRKISFFKDHVLITRTIIFQNYSKTYFFLFFSWNLYEIWMTKWKHEYQTNHTKNTTWNNIFARFDFFLFWFFYNFHKKQKELVVNKQENIKIKITKKTGQKREKYAKKSQKSKSQHKSNNAGQQDDVSGLDI